MIWRPYREIRELRNRLALVESARRSEVAQHDATINTLVLREHELHAIAQERLDNASAALELAKRRDPSADACAILTGLGLGDWSAIRAILDEYPPAAKKLALELGAFVYSIFPDDHTPEEVREEIGRHARRLAGIEEDDG